MSNAVELSLKTQKIVYRGEKFRKILSFSCYNLNDLPLRYLSDEQALCFEANGKLINIFGNREIIEIKVGQNIPDKTYRNIVRNMTYCGNRLHQAFETIKELKKTWQGEEEFKI